MHVMNWAAYYLWRNGLFYLTNPYLRVEYLRVYWTVSFAWEAVISNGTNNAYIILLIENYTIASARWIGKDSSRIW